MSTKPPQPCSMCANTTTNICGTCKSSAYCSKECQKADWPTHKILCASFATFTTAPSSTHRLGILLPEKSPTPRLIWVNCPLEFDDYNGVWWEWAECPELGFRPARSMSLGANAFRKRWRTDQLNLYYNDDATIEGGGLNHCVRAITRGGSLHPWPGSLLVMRLPGLDIDPGKYLNVQMVDFRDAIDLLVAYRVANIHDMTGIPRPDT